MRPIVIVVAVAIVVAIVAYKLMPAKKANPQESVFIESVVDLMLLSAVSDTLSDIYVVKRDSILTGVGMSDTALMRIKSELNESPDELIDLWGKIEERLKEKRDSLGLPGDTASQ